MAPRWRCRRLGEVERRVLLEDRLLELLERPPGLETELFHQRAPRVLIGLQRLRLASTPVEGQHQLPARALAQRVAGDEGFELGDEISLASEREVGVDPFLDGRQAQLLEPGDLLRRERLECEVGERRAAPQLQRLTKQHFGVACRAFGQGGSALRQHRGEVLRVELSGLESEHVARRLRHEHRAAAFVREHFPKLRDVPLDDLRRSRRRPIAPNLVDQSVVRDHFVRVQKENGQKRTLPASPDVQEAASPHDLQRAEDTKLDHAIAPKLARSPGGCRRSLRGRLPNSYQPAPFPHRLSQSSPVPPSRRKEQQ